MIKTAFVSRNIHGWNCLDTLPDEVRRLGADTVLLVTDPFLVHNGTANRIISMLAAAGISCTVESRVAAEPPLALAEELVAAARQRQAGAVVGLGGGSAVDLAKLIAALCPQQGAVRDYLNLTGSRTPERPPLPKIMIPTTSGTGSEVTDIAVLSLEDSKDVVVHESLLADTVIVDPALTVSVPPAVTAATGIDALTHAVESYVSKLATPISEALSLQAVRLIARSLVKACRDGSDCAARTDMSYGSYLAGLAFFNAGCAAVHALAYPLGGRFHIAHGDSNAVLLPYVMGYIRPSCEKKLKDILEALGFSASGLSQQEAAEKCIRELQNLTAAAGIAPTLKDFGIPESAIGALTEAACLQTRLLGRSPMALSADDIETIYRAAYHGQYFA